MIENLGSVTNRIDRVLLTLFVILHLLVDSILPKKRLSYIILTARKLATSDILDIFAGTTLINSSE